MTVLIIVLPIFLVIASGFLLRYFNVVKLEWVHVLNRFVYFVALPALIITSFWQVDWLDLDLLALVGFNIVAILLLGVFLLMALSCFKMGDRLKARIFLVCMVGNTVYIGFPLLGSAFKGSDYNFMVAVAAAHLVIGMVFSIMAVEMLVIKSQKIKTYFVDFIKNPLIISLLAGIILSLTSLNGAVVEIFKKPLLMLGAAASPVALFALGGFLHGKFYKAHFKLALLASLVKLAILPVAIWSMAWFTEVSGTGQKISALVSTMPTAVTAFVIAEKYKLDESFVANAILISTALSVFTISGFLLVWMF